MERIFYYGTSLENLSLDNSFKSRYKVPIIFLSSKVTLSENFAKECKVKIGKGFLYKIKVKGNPIIENYNGVTYSADFRNRVFDFIKSGQSYLILNNCNDRPNEKFNFENIDIAIIADFNLIKEIELVKII